MLQRNVRTRRNIREIGANSNLGIQYGYCLVKCRQKRFSLFLTAILSLAHLRLEVIILEEKNHRLQDELNALKSRTQNCDKKRKKERKFFKHLIEYTKGDNVQLSDEGCVELCSKSRVKDVDCKLMCYSDTISKKCADWPNLEKCLKEHHHFNNNENSLQQRNVRSIPEYDMPHSFSNDQIGSDSSKFNKSLDDLIEFLEDYNDEDYVEENEALIRRDIMPMSEDSTRSQSFSLDQRVPMSSDVSKIMMINVSYLGDLSLRTWTPKASCSSISCHLAPNYQATFCFQKHDPTYYFQFGQHEDTNSKNVPICAYLVFGVDIILIAYLTINY